MTSESEDPIGRRKFLRGALLATGGLLLLAGGIAVWRETRPRVSLLWVKSVNGPTHALGHRLRKPDFPSPSSRRKHQVVIIGGGITGLSAARFLQQQGVEDFVLLEMESETGGNSRSGKNGVSSFPLGAHYLPLPTADNTQLLELLRELKVITRMDEAGLPTYREEYLCHDPMERLLIHGIWQEGIVPHHGVPEADRAQIKSFIERMRSFRELKGTDGKPLFTFPLRNASAAPQCQELDGITMGHWLEKNGFTSPYLQWYVDYCCRDDYGAPAGKVSAYAGIHYYASRGGKGANAQEGDILTWPEGNAWLARELRQQVEQKILTSQMAFAIRNAEHGAEVDVFSPATNESITFEAEFVICAIPQFVAGRIMQDRKQGMALQYAPWLVANVTLRSLPQGVGAPLSWDNVNYQGNSLGYIVATHQRLAGFPGTDTVITCYQPLDREEKMMERTNALQRSPEEWQAIVMEDLERMHPGISSEVADIAVWVWGHGMVTPVPGLIWGQARSEAQKPLGRVHFAHSDLSGISVFEEAFDQGNRAAEEVLLRMRS